MIIRQYQCPAKINLFLKLFEQRKDSYHNILSLIYKIPLFDKMKIFLYDKNENFKIEEPFYRIKNFYITGNLEICRSEKNIIVRILKSLKDEEILFQKGNIKIHIEKNIPSGSGLGGASSNGAAFLKWMQDTFNLNMNNKIWKEKILNWGSDIPLFLEKGNLISLYKRGEVFDSDRVKISYPLLIISPSIRFSSREAYIYYSKNLNKNFNFDKKKDKEEMNILKKNILKNQLRNLNPKNDFYTIQSKRYPFLIDIYKVLKKNSIFSHLTGSGSCFYAFFKNEESIFKTQNILKNLNHLALKYFIIK